MSTIKARKSSPKKVRPATGSANVSMTKTQKLLAPLTVEHITTFNIIQELNNEDLGKQECQVENERLKVTCYTLNNKVSITEDLQQDKEVLTKRLEESETIRDQQQKEIAEYERNRLEQEKRIGEYEKNRVLQKEQMDHLIGENKSLRVDMEELLVAKTKLQAELEDATDYIISMEEKVYKSNRISLELLKQLKDAELEIQALQAYIIDLKSRIAIYIPMKDDVVDKKLAEFINNYPERQKLKIMFMRESNGVYQFGSKKVAVKVEKDQIKIRVGGGYLSIDEFLDQYTPLELEKLERKDPMKRFSEKVAVQKTVQNRSSSPAKVAV